MGIYITCGDKSIQMTYSTWAYFRQELIKITLIYLEKLCSDNNSDNSLDNSSNKSHYFRLIDDFCKMIRSCEYDYNVLDVNLLVVFLNNITSQLCYLDAFVYFGVDGLYSLCCKSDCDGLYSPGNSLDICNFFDFMKDYIKAHDQKLYDHIYIPDDNRICIYDVFYNSWKNNKYASIA